MSVREELEKLSRLQEIDLKIDRARKLVTAAPSALSTIETEIRQLRQELQKIHDQRMELEKQKKGIEIENMMDRDRIKNIEDRLNAVTNNKEFHAANKEAEKAKKLITDRENNIVSLAEKTKAEDEREIAVNERIAELEGQLNSKKKELGDQIGEADKEIESYNGDRDEVIGSIQSALISRYNRLRSRYSDPVVAAINGACTSCNVALPPQVFIQLQKGSDYISCPNCQRLLFFKIQ